MVICQNCGKEIANDKKPNGKGGRPPKYCKECADLINNHKKSEYFCEKCGRPIYHKSTTIRIKKLCAICQAEERREADRLRKSENSALKAENPNPDKPNKNMG